MSNEKKQLLGSAIAILQNEVNKTVVSPSSNLGGSIPTIVVLSRETASVILEHVLETTTQSQSLKLPEGTKLVFCDFCDKSQHEVKRLITGPRKISICDECVSLCGEILQEEKAAEGKPG